MTSERIYNLTHSDKTLTAAFATSPDSSPGELGKTLYAEHHHGIHKPNATGGITATIRDMLKTGHAPDEAKEAVREDDPTPEDLDRAAECGQFGTRPTDLFLKVSLFISGITLFWAALSALCAHMTTGGSLNQHMRSEQVQCVALTRIVCCTLGNLNHSFFEDDCPSSFPRFSCAYE